MRKVEELKLIAFANTCCFYCWQHAAMYVGEKVTWASNITYYATHPEDILSVFYDDVQVTKLFGTVTYYVDSLGELRRPSDVIKNMFSIYGTVNGAFSTAYWIVFAMVFMYDTLEPMLMQYLYDSPDAIQQMSETAADVLLELQE